MSKALTDADLLEYVDGVASPEIARRIVRAALRDPEIRGRLRTLQELDQKALECAAESTTDSAPFGAAMSRILRTVAAEAATPSPEASPSVAASLLDGVRSILSSAATGARLAGGGLWNVGHDEPASGLREFWEAISRAASRTLITGRHALTLPCFAPAAATSTADLTLRRESVTTADGVRIEFQQLPSAGPSRLRVLIDASLLAPEIRELGYNVAFLTLEDGGLMSLTGAPDAPEAGATSPPDRHILVVALNGEGRGFTDFQVGVVGAGVGGILGNALPAARGVCRLTGVTLSRIDSGSGSTTEEEPAARQ